MKRKNLTKQIDVDSKHEQEDPCWKDMHRLVMTRPSLRIKLRGEFVGCKGGNTPHADGSRGGNPRYKNIGVVIPRKLVI